MIFIHALNGTPLDGLRRGKRHTGVVKEEAEEGEEGEELERGRG